MTAGFTEAEWDAALPWDAYLETVAQKRDLWLANLRRAKVDYRTEDVPNCRHKIEHGVQMIFRFYKPAKAMMRRIADVLYKVESNIDALREYERAKR